MHKNYGMIGYLAHMLREFNSINYSMYLCGVIVHALPSNGVDYNASIYGLYCLAY